MSAMSHATVAGSGYIMLHLAWCMVEEQCRFVEVRSRDAMQTEQPGIQ